MSLGSVSRILLGHKLFKVAGTMYRRIFFNAKDFVDCTQHLFSKGQCIDIGGGDGFLANRLLAHHHLLTVTLVDPSRNCGTWVGKEFHTRFNFHPNMTTYDLLPEMAGKYDSALLADVVHHVTPAHRSELITQALELLKPGGSLLIKEIEPKGLRAKLAYLADVYISKDPVVNFISQHDLVNFIRSTLKMGYEIKPNNLGAKDFPNYAIEIIKS